MSIENLIQSVRKKSNMKEMQTSIYWEGKGIGPHRKTMEYLCGKTGHTPPFNMDTDNEGEFFILKGPVRNGSAEWQREHSIALRDTAVNLGYDCRCHFIPIIHKDNTIELRIDTSTKVKLICDKKQKEITFEDITEKPILWKPSNWLPNADIGLFRNSKNKNEIMRKLIALVERDLCVSNQWKYLIGRTIYLDEHQQSLFSPKAIIRYKQDVTEVILRYVNSAFELASPELRRRYLQWAQPEKIPYLGVIVE